MSMESCAETSKIKLRELETSFINSPVVAPFCISWSKDNKISVVVEGGVFIFELWPTPLSNQPSVTFSKSWIPANLTSPLCNSIVENENGAFLWSLARKEVYEVTLDSTLSHAVQRPNSNTGSSHIIQCEFSPLIACKSYISCLTNNGLLEIYKNSLKKWISVANITKLWIAHCSFKNDSHKTNFGSFKSKMFTLKIITMKWVERPEILFMTGHENGEVVLWNIDVVNDNFSVSVKHCFKVDGKPIHLNLSEMPMTKNIFLYVGLLSGIVKCLCVDLKTGAVISKISLWEYEDCITPNRIITQLQTNKLFVFVIKRHVLLIQCVSVNESNHELQVSETHYEEFSTMITGWDEYQDSFIMCLQNHDVYLLTVSSSGKQIVCHKKFNDMGIKKKHKSSYSCFGLTMSQNKAIWILISSPKVNYNTTKDITHFIMFSPEVKVFKSLSDRTSSDLIEKILQNCKSVQLNEIFDLLELKKLELLTEAVKFKENYDTNENLPLVQLQLMLWEVKLKSFCNLMDQDSLVNELEFSITKNRAKRTISALRKLDSLSALKKKSLDTCELFLMGNKEKTKSLDEVCVICGCESFMYNIRISSCSNLHKFPRCCLSLLACDTVPYAICRNCESVALTDFVMENDNRCPYCDGLLELDARFRTLRTSADFLS